MSTAYALEYRAPDGTLLAIIDDFSRLDYARKENEPGYLELVLPVNVLGIGVTPVLDGRLEVYRSVGAGAPYLDMDAVWLIRGWQYEKQGGTSSLVIKARDAIQLLDRRIVAYAADTAYSSKTNQGDDMMKDIVRENFGALATDVNRNIAAYMTVEVDLTLAPSIVKAFAWRDVLATFQELAQASFDLGTYLVFDVVRTGAGTLEFRTFVNQRGVDRGSGSAAPLVISDTNGALVDASLTYNYLEEKTYAYIGGRGEGIDRNLIELNNVARSTATVLNRCEIFQDARQTDLDASLTAEANEVLKNNRPNITIEGRITETENTLYGVHYNYGDIVAAQFDAFLIDAHVSTAHVTVEHGQETLDIYIRGETDV